MVAGLILWITGLVVVVITCVAFLKGVIANQKTYFVRTTTDNQVEHRGEIIDLVGDVVMVDFVKQIFIAMNIAALLFAFSFIVR